MGVLLSYMADVLSAAQGRGLDIAPVLRGAGVPWEMLEDREARISHAQLDQLWLGLERAAGSSRIGLLLLEHGLRPTSFGAAGYRAMTSPTLGDALEAGVRYHPVIKPNAVVRIEHRDDVVVIVHEFSPDTPRSCVDFAVGTFAVLARRWTTSEETPIEVGVLNKATEDRLRYEATFGCPVQFGQREATVTFARHQLDAPLTNAYDELAEHFDEMASQALAQSKAEPSFEQELREAVLCAVRQGDVRLTPVAEALGCSQRTLQRRLKEHELRFQAIADEVRCAEAMRLLRHTDMPVTSVAEQLGYADDKSFRRAFRRWTKSSPVEARQQARAVRDAGR